MNACNEVALARKLAENWHLTGATFSDWIDSFRRDFMPTRSVAEFMRMAKSYLKLTEGLEPTDLRPRKQVFNLLVCGDEAVAGQA